MLPYQGSEFRGGSQSQSPFRPATRAVHKFRRWELIQTTPLGNGESFQNKLRVLDAVDHLALT